MHDFDIGQALFNLMGLLSHASFNFWPYLFFTVLPVIIFSVRPNATAKLRISRIIVAIILGYIFINVSKQTSHNIVWDTYQTCQSQFSDGAIQHHKECGEINIVDGASNVFAIIFGWIPAMAYVGIWELIWRIVYRKRIRELGTEFKGKTLSNLLAGTALIISILLIWQFLRVFIIH